MTKKQDLVFDKYQLLRQISRWSPKREKIKIYSIQSIDVGLMTYTSAISKSVGDCVQHCDVQCENLSDSDFQEKLNGSD